MARKLKGRLDSAGSCEGCGWDLDRFAQCTNVECDYLDESVGADESDDADEA